jgi:hypothetical protein
MATMIEKTDAGWIVVKDGKVLATCSSNAEAWRWIDRYQGDPVSRSEKVADRQRRLDA